MNKAEKFLTALKVTLETMGDEKDENPKPEKIHPLNDGTSVKKE